MFRYFSLFMLALVGLGFQSGSSYANVSLRNGNFFIGYTDIEYPGGFQPKFERVYNSKSPYNGILGWGWGTEYEVYLTVSVDSSVIVHEFGGGAENRFVPKGFGKQDLVLAVNNLMKAAKKSGFIGNKNQETGYREKLMKNAIFRNDEWVKFVKRGVLKPRVLKLGTQLISNRFSFQYITKVKSGYVRTFDNGKREYFSNAGKLTKVADKNNNFIEFFYSKAGKLSKLVDSFNRKMFFFFNSQGLLSKIEGENGKKAIYKYNSIRELVYSRDVDGNVYRFQYSSDKRHNLVAILYSDKTEMKIEYYGRDQNENVKSVRNRDQTLTAYKYFGSSTKGNFKVSVKVTSKKGKLISQGEYAYEMKVRSTGEQYIYKLSTRLDGEVTTTVYNECCGLPLSINRNGQTTRFAYDKKGHVTKKDTPTKTTRLKYNWKLGKVIQVNEYSKISKRRFWSKFQYDDKTGNLLRAENSRKKKVKLIYDLKGRIASMIDQNRRVIRFKYNNNSKPIEIIDPKRGSIRITYKNSGEVKKVDSSAGRKIATEVNAALQNLLDIIRPAGVTLAF